MLKTVVDISIIPCWLYPFKQSSEHVNLNLKFFAKYERKRAKIRNLFNQAPDSNICLFLSCGNSSQGYTH